MAKRGRQKNRTGNSKRPPAPSLGGAAATKLPSVNPGALPEQAAAAAREPEREDKPSSKRQIVASERAASERPAASESPAAAESVAAAEGVAAAAQPEKPALESSKDSTPALESSKDSTPSPISFDVDKAPVEVDEFEEAFFSSLPPGMHATEYHDDHEELDARTRRLHEPDVVARRDRMRRFVAWGLAACAAVFFLAVGRAALEDNDASAPRVQNAADSVQTPAVVATPPVEGALPTVEAPVAVVEPAVVASAAPSAEADLAAAMSAAPAVSAAPAAAPVPSVPSVPSAAPAIEAASGDGKALRTQAQRLLEANKANEAIAAALESTVVEPEHAGGWLLLGAAYQTRGRNAEARQAFVTCVKTAKRGPRGECAAMLR